MGAITQNGKYRFPEWLHVEKLVIRVIEANTGVKIRIPKMWLTQNSGAPVGYPDRTHYANPIQYQQMTDRGETFYEEDFYEFCRYERYRELPRRMPILIPHECRVYPGMSKAELIDCGILRTRQFWRWYPTAKAVEPNPDKVFQSKPLFVLEGAYNEIPQPYVYLTRDNVWDMPTYNFYPCVWVFKPVSTVVKDVGDWFIPVMPTIALYPHDSYSQFDDADTRGMPFQWEGSVQDNKQEAK